MKFKNIIVMGILIAFIDSGACHKIFKTSSIPTSTAQRLYSDSSRITITIPLRTFVKAGILVGGAHGIAQGLRTNHKQLDTYANGFFAIPHATLTFFSLGTYALAAAPSYYGGRALGRGIADLLKERNVCDKSK